MGRTFAVGDIHGRLDLLLKAIKWIEERADGGSVIFLGDYFDRGPDSKGVVSRLMKGPSSKNWTWYCLKGNHEDMVIEAKKRQNDLDLQRWWIANGGHETLLSYDENVDPAHVRWASDMTLDYVEDAYRVYVHAGADPSKVMSDQTEATLRWYRYPEGADIGCLNKHVVHGHTPEASGYPLLLKKRSCIDVGSFFTGKLCVAVFDDDVSGGPIEVKVV